MALSFTQALCYRLGYSVRDFQNRFTGVPIIIPEYTADDIEALQEIIDKLIALDLELETNRADSMALDVGGVKVDFNRNIQITKSEGSRLLKELSYLSDIPVKYDKYLGRRAGSNSTTPLVVRNYY
jgi:hypothetical protein